MLTFGKNQTVKIEGHRLKDTVHMTTTALTLAIKHAKEKHRVIYLIDNEANIENFFDFMQRVSNQADLGVADVKQLDIIVFRAESSSTIYNVTTWVNKFTNLIDAKADTLFVIDTEDAFGLVPNDNNLIKLQTRVGCNLLVTLPQALGTPIPKVTISILIDNPLEIEADYQQTENTDIREDIFYSIYDESKILEYMLKEAVKLKEQGYIIDLFLGNKALLTLDNYYASLQRIILEHDLPIDILNLKDFNIYMDRKSYKQALDETETEYEGYLKSLEGEGEAGFEEVDDADDEPSTHAFITYIPYDTNDLEEEQVIKEFSKNRYPNTKFIFFARSPKAGEYKNIHKLGYTASH